MGNNRTKKEKGLSDTEFVTIYRTLYEEYTSSGAQFTTEEASSVAVGGQITDKMLTAFLQNYCSSMQIGEGSYWVIDPGAQRAIRLESEIGLTQKEEKKSEVHMTPPPVRAARDINVREDGLPHLRPNIPYGVAKPGLKDMKTFPKAKAVESTLPAEPEEIDPRAEVKAMPSDELFEAHGHYRSVGNHMMEKMAEEELKYRSDLKNNPFYVPGFADFKGDKYKDITHIVRSHFFDEYEHIFLEEGVYNFLDRDRDFGLYGFVKAATDRKLRQNLKFEPYIGGKRHNVLLLSSEDEKDMIFIKCIPLE